MGRGVVGKLRIKYILSFLMLILIVFSIIPFVVSEGLIIFPNSFVVNKTVNLDKSILFNVTNIDNITFFNISIQTNSQLSFPVISQLIPNQTAVVNASVFGDNNFDGSIRIKPFFISNLGQTFKTKNLTVNFNGVSECDISIVEGDSILWKNLEDDNVVLKNADTNEIIVSIPAGDSYTASFNNPQIFNYYITNLGIPITPICHVSVLSTSGLINDPIKDGILNLKLNIDFLPTNIELTLLSSDYTIEAGSSISDILNIKNTGTNTAKNIILSGSWITFSNNGFDLQPQQSINLGFTIVPSIINSSETNKSYLKNIKVEGNFPLVNRTLNITIPFKSSISSEGSITSLEDLMKSKLVDLTSYCNENANKLKDICVIFKERITSSGINSTNININEVILEMARVQREMKSEQSKDVNSNKLLRNQTESDLNLLRDINNQTSLELALIRNDVSGIGGTIGFAILTSLGLPILISLIFLIMYFRNKKNEEKTGDYY